MKIQELSTHTPKIINEEVRILYGDTAWSSCYVEDERERFAVTLSADHYRYYIFF